MSSVSIQGNASGTGIFTIASPNSNTNRTLTLPDNTGTILTGSSAITASQLPAGSVIQVVETTSTSTVTNSTATPVDLLTVSITPSSASNKILVISSFTCQINPSANAYAGGFIYRGVSATGTQLQVLYWGVSSAVTSYGTFCLCRLDSPATTSAQNYSLSFAKASGGTSSVSTDGTRYTLTLLEIAA